MTAALGFDPTTLAPTTGAVSSAASANMDIYTAILAGFSELLAGNSALAAFNNAETWAIVEAIALDLTDGQLDGVTITGNGICVDDGTGTCLPFPALSQFDISALRDAAVAWAAINLPSVVIPPIDLTLFGNPIITPGGDWDVSGSLTVTASGAAAFGGTFTPTGVIESVGGNKVDGFTFFVGDPSYYVSISFDDTTPAGTINGVSAGRGEAIWINTGGPPPVPGATISLLPPYEVNLSGVLITEIGGETLLIFNGTLTVTPR